MKNIILTAVVVLSAVAAHAQQASPLRTQSNADYVKVARVQLEKDTEQKILEQLEAARIRDEQNRMRVIEETDFTVQHPAPQN